MNLNEHQIAGIASHVGYGSPKAALWFVGTEEGLGGATSPEEDERNLAARAAWLPEMDMHLAHRTLTEKGTSIDISRPRAGHTGVWQWMAKIARAFDGAEDFCDTAKANAYVRASDGLGRAAGSTFLTELRPFPSKSANQPAALRGFGERASVEQLLQRRRERQLWLLGDGNDKCVICYGSSARQRFADHFGLKWQPLASYRWTSSSGKPRETAVWQAIVDAPTSATIQFFMLPFLGNGALSEAVLHQFVQSEAFQICRTGVN